QDRPDHPRALSAVSPLRRPTCLSARDDAHATAAQLHDFLAAAAILSPRSAAGHPSDSGLDRFVRRVAIRLAARQAQSTWLSRRRSARPVVARPHRPFRPNRSCLAPSAHPPSAATRVSLSAAYCRPLPGFPPLRLGRLCPAAARRQ